MTTDKYELLSAALKCCCTQNHSLLALFTALSAGQVLHLFLVDLDLSGLLHLLAQVDDKQAEKLLLLVLQKQIAGLIFLRGKILRSRSLLLQEGQNRAGGAVVDGAADLARLHTEGNGSAPGHGADVGDLPVGQHEIAGLNGGAEFF